MEAEGGDGTTDSAGDDGGGGGGGLAYAIATSFAGGAAVTAAGGVGPLAGVDGGVGRSALQTLTAAQIECFHSQGVW